MEIFAQEPSKGKVYVVLQLYIVLVCELPLTQTATSRRLHTPTPRAWPLRQFLDALFGRQICHDGMTALGRTARRSYRLKLRIAPRANRHLPGRPCGGAAQAVSVSATCRRDMQEPSLSENWTCGA